MSTAAACLSGAQGAVRRILLIEDSALLCERLVALISEPGRVTVAAQAATQDEAQELLEHGCYDVLVVDIELAQGSGVAVVRRARALYGPASQPLIVVLTNHACDFVREHCLAAGADYFLDKMRDIAQLKPLVAGARRRWNA
jgi:CheY-like chemotaxis protein